MKPINTLTRHLAISLLFLLPFSLFAQDIAANARSFTLEGLSLGMTKEAFMKKYPTAYPLDEQTDARTGTVGFRVDQTVNTDGIDAAFYEGKLLEFYVWYFPKRINNMGGDKVIVKRLVERFGKASPESEYTSDIDARLIWKIEEANFFLQMLIKSDKTLVNATDSAAWSKRETKKAESANPGF